METPELWCGISMKKVLQTGGSYQTFKLISGHQDRVSLLVNWFYESSSADTFWSETEQTGTQKKSLVYGTPVHSFPRAQVRTQLGDRFLDDSCCHKQAYAFWIVVSYYFGLRETSNVFSTNKHKVEEILVKISLGIH